MGTSQEFQAAKARLDAERQRQRDIRDSGRLAEIPSGMIDAAIRDGVDLDSANARFLAHIRNTRHEAARIAVGEDLAARLGPDLGRCWAVAEGVTEAATSKDQRIVRDLGKWDLRRIAEHCIQQEGGKMPGPADLFDRAISTASFAAVLHEANTKLFSDTLNKYEPTSPAWTDMREVRDFRDAYEVQLSDDNGSLPLVPRGAEFQHSVLSDGKESMSVVTYGEQFVLDRQSIINDDLAVLRSAPVRMARKAMRLPDDLVYALLTSASGLGPTLAEDSKPLFDASRTFKNYHTGGSSALGDPGFDAADVAMALVRGLGATSTTPPLGLQSKVLLVPKALAKTAFEWMSSTDLVASGLASTSAYSKSARINPWRGRWQVVVEPRLDSATNGETAWYLVCDPQAMPSIVRVYLRGLTQPTIERADPVNVLGIGWRCFWDVGAAAVNWRGIARSDGV